MWLQPPAKQGLSFNAMRCGHSGARICSACLAGMADESLRLFRSIPCCSESFEPDRTPGVAAWVKNDHLGFEVLYVFKGIVRKYRPDFIVRLISGDYLVLETKGEESHQDRTKRRFLDEWIRAVDADGCFGRYGEVFQNPADLKDILDGHHSDDSNESREIT